MKRTGIWFGAGLIAAALLLLHARAHVRITTGITWARDIRPILRDKCMGCHHPGGVAPDYIDLTTYGYRAGKTGARDWAKAIEEQVLTRRMPPWKADSRFGSFSNHRVLTQEEIDKIAAWSRGGAPQGTPRDLPPPPEFAQRDWTLGQPELVLSMPAEHVIDPARQFDQISSRIAIDVPEDRWITAYEFLPGNPAVVHSIRAFVHDPPQALRHSLRVEVRRPYDPLAKEEDLTAVRERLMPEGPHFIGQWTRGDKAVLLPDGAGRLLRKGSSVELQVTYLKGMNDSSREYRDLSRLGLYFAPEPVDLLLESRMLGTEPAVVGAAPREVRIASTTDENVHLIAIHPGMGFRGKDLEVRGIYPDGKSLTLLWIPQYDYLWESSYVFDKPVSAPAGFRIELIGHYEGIQNPGGPAAEPESASGSPQDRLVAWIDYTLDDHLIVSPPPSPITEEARADRPPAVSTSAATPVPAREVFWCPMRGAKGCGVKDYYAPGFCDVCKMRLEPKSKVLEKYRDQIAATAGRWELTSAGREELYLCPNRGRPDHRLTTYSAPGVCEVCGGRLIHSARFAEVKTWTCLTDSCSYREKLFYSPGRCPECGEPVESMGHMDHNPVHGGVLFMAENQYHHLEGTHPSPDEFRMYFYDDYKRPMDPRNFKGRMVIEEWDAKKSAYVEKQYTLALEKEGNLWLTSRIPIPVKYPIELIPRVWLSGEEKLFNFFFNGATREPEAKPGSAIRPHLHGDRTPPEVPEAAPDVVREILKRDRLIEERIEAKDWFGLHDPAFDIIDLAAALKRKTDGLNPRSRQRLGEVVVALSSACDRLDKAGDASDEGRVRAYHREFKTALAELAAIFRVAAK